MTATACVRHHSCMQTLQETLGEARRRGAISDPVLRAIDSSVRDCLASANDDTPGGGCDLCQQVDSIVRRYVWPECKDRLRVLQAEVNGLAMEAQVAPEKERRDELRERQFALENEIARFHAVLRQKPSEACAMINRRIGDPTLDVLELAGDLESQVERAGFYVPSIARAFFEARRDAKKDRGHGGSSEEDGERVWTPKARSILCILERALGAPAADRFRTALKKFAVGFSAAPI